jgi:hypothetical protein
MIQAPRTERSQSPSPSPPHLHLREDGYIKLSDRLKTVLDRLLYIGKLKV